MLANAFRIRSTEDFEKVQREGEIKQSESFGMVILHQPQNKVSRFGFIVSTKISKEAVSRNRIKRAMSESVRFLMTEIKKGYDVVFLVKQTSLRKSTDELMREVRRALSDAGLITK
ncbi:MAG: ribonuclease P protein component [Nanoarchaeota archaeon]